jgi:hypothetical protein
MVTTLNATSSTVAELVTEIMVALAGDAATVPAKAAKRTKVLRARRSSFMTRSPFGVSQFSDTNGRQLLSGTHRCPPIAQMMYVILAVATSGIRRGRKPVTMGTAVNVASQLALKAEARQSFLVAVASRLARAWPSRVRAS